MVNQIHCIDDKYCKFERYFKQNSLITKNKLNWVALSKIFLY
ncbi:hypothetical protein GLIP_0941 [Aliiglaciecola lipolytica E3]|uniref:Uncharacterized protein n=1 Tax=Aliiglaciecola lipolytica E3 TaxID=1127673 RepID=K6WYQ2_9ALTE|nr:hypothetical protein GLIP_0941 [Aliiglaciecola lipolytica E3]